MSTVHDSPQTLQLQTWIDAIADDDLRKQGWSKSSLTQSFQGHPFLVLEEAGSILSVLVYQDIASGPLEILFLATHPRFQNQGAMSSLFDEFFRRHPGRAVWLECREDNLTARHLYLKKGFRESGRRQRYYKDGSAAILFNYLPT